MPDAAPDHRDEPENGDVLRFFPSRRLLMPMSNRTEIDQINLGRADRSTLQDRVYEKLRKGLMTGKFVPGQTFSIRALARSLGTSPIPVREALKRLCAERGLEVLPNGSLIVPEIDRARFLDLRRTRILIEGYATQLGVERFTPTLLVRTEKLFEEMKSAQNVRDAKSFLLKNYNMRFSIYRAAESPTLLPIIESLWLQVGPLFNLVFTDTALPASMDHDARAIEAMRRGDAIAARRAIEGDIMETGDFILQTLPART